MMLPTSDTMLVAVAKMRGCRVPEQALMNVLQGTLPTEELLLVPLVVQGKAKQMLNTRRLRVR